MPGVASSGLDDEQARLSDGEKKSCRKLIVRVIVADVLVAVVTPVINYVVEAAWGVRMDIVLMSGAALIASITFLGVWYAERLHRVSDASVAMRDAIAAGFVLVYLCVVSWSAFFNYQREGDEMKLSPITENMINNFTTLTGVVVAFYFGAQALTAAAKYRADGRDRTAAKRAGDTSATSAD